MKPTHLKFLPSAALLVLFCLPWLEVWEWGGCMPGQLASASGFQMVLGTGSADSGGDIGIPKMDEENRARVLAIASPRRWAGAVVGLLLPLAIGLALAGRPNEIRRRELQAFSLLLLGGLGAWFCTVASKVPCFDYCPDPRQYRGLFADSRNPFMSFFGIPEAPSLGGPFVNSRVGLEASFLLYAIIATAGIVLIVLYEQRRRKVAE